jgi:hypothetical protein
MERKETEERRLNLDGSEQRNPTGARNVLKLRGERRGLKMPSGLLRNVGPNTKIWILRECPFAIDWHHVTISNCDSIYRTIWE